MTRRLDPDRLHRAVDDLSHRYVDAARLPFTITQVTQRGEVVLRHSYGFADHERTAPIAADAIVRIYSMTKPVTSIAMMQLVEAGHALLANPVRRWIPELGGLSVWAGGTKEAPEVVPAERDVTLHDVLTHTAGFTTGFQYQHPLDALYRDGALGDLFQYPRYSLEEAMKLLGELPLVHQPGARWTYGMSTEVVARVIEVISGQSLDEDLTEHIFEPLGMHHTGFWADDDDRVARLTPSWTRDKGKRLRVMDSGDPGSGRTRRPHFLSGAGGLLSTLDDYQRFCDALSGGGAAHGSRIIGTRTLEHMTTNHLPGNATTAEMAAGQSVSTAEGEGFGLGFSVMIDPALARRPSSVGEFHWGGAASTIFWIDPAEEITAIFLTQLLPSGTYPLQPQLRWAVYQALVDD
jgi:CubicO group peptidase (beta-lactamase class C family)